MASGGARTRNGPAPDMNALKREYDGKDWTRLPEQGRQGPTPEWPFMFADPTMNELAMWAELWRKPQACIWEIEGSHDNVAMYVRTFIAAAKHDGSLSARLLVKQLGEKLLLDHQAMKAARVIIKGTAGEVNLGTGGIKPTRQRVSRKSAQSRFTVVPPPDEETP